MSFSIVLKRNNSPSNFVSKSTSDVATVTGVLRSGASILDPVILIETDTPATVISSANYAYIEVFSRYYYITNVKSDANGLWIVSMHVDVLMTYESAIRAQDAIVRRQERVYNMYLDDGWFMSYQNPIIQTKYFSNATPFEAEEYVLTLAGS